MSSLMVAEIHDCEHGLASGKRNFTLPKLLRAHAQQTVPSWYKAGNCSILQLNMQQGLSASTVPFTTGTSMAKGGGADTPTIPAITLSMHSSLQGMQLVSC